MIKSSFSHRGYLKDKEDYKMQLFIDSANVAEIENAVRMGFVDGVTTNPSIISRERKTLLECFRDIQRIVPDLRILVEVVSKKDTDMEAEAKELSAMGENVVVKLPCTSSGLAVVRRLSRLEISTTVTLVFSVTQAIAAACAGANYVAPFVGRLEDIDSDGIGMIQEIKSIFATNGTKTKIIAASVRSPRAVSELFLAGADIVTAPFRVIDQMLTHPLTQQGLEIFDHDWRTVPVHS